MRKQIYYNHTVDRAKDLLEQRKLHLLISVIGTTQYPTSGICLGSYLGTDRLYTYGGKTLKVLGDHTYKRALHVKSFATMSLPEA